MCNFKIRVIVPCFNSDKTIENCVASICNSKGIDFELYIVDDGNNNKLDKICENHPAKIIKTSGQEGAGRARNIGAVGFNGQVVVFIDSDVQIFENTLAFLVKPVLERLSGATVGGYIKSRRNNFYETYKQYYLANKYNQKHAYLTNTFWSAICAIDYEVFTKIQGFKEFYSGAGPEDIVLGMDLSLLGARILSVPNARGIHLSTLNFIKLLKNDMRKGSEDFYIHLSRRVSIKYNRHVNRIDVFAVGIACMIPFAAIFSCYTGYLLLLTSSLLYVMVRISYINKTFGGEGSFFIIKSFLMTYLLDVIRGCAVMKGSLYFISEKISSGKYKPFIKPSLLKISG